MSGQYTPFGGFQSYSQALAPGVPPQQSHFNAAPAPPTGAPGKSFFMCLQKCQCMLQKVN